jgi:hypothetical protein
MDLEIKLKKLEQENRNVTQLQKNNDRLTKKV